VEKYLDHADPEVRAKAVSAFARMSDAAGWERILEKAADPNESVRAAAAEALGAFPARP
jgi:HEAT repeat protein